MPELEREPGGDGKADLWNDNQVIRMPFSAGTSVTLSQTFHGGFSHQEAQAYAIDFPVAEGTPVVAARSGVVVAARSDSNVGCGDPSCANDANYVVIDHGDGSLARYYHLQQGGVSVAVGEMVCRGEEIGRSGNTGFSTGPHLHFEVVNPFNETVPVLLQELARVQLDELPDTPRGTRLHGVPFPGATITSDNVPVACEPVEPSTCDDYFIHFGVRLESDTPCTAASYDREYEVSGISFGSSDRVVIGQMGAAGWSYTCAEVEREPGLLHGRFRATITWPRAQYGGSPETYLMMLGARGNPDGSCSWDWGWWRSARVYLAD